MATVHEALDQMLEKIREQTTRLTSLEAFVEELYKAIRDKQLSPEDQAKVDEVFAALQNNANVIEEAFKENTPSA